MCPLVLAHVATGDSKEFCQGYEPLGQSCNRSNQHIHSSSRSENQIRALWAYIPSENNRDAIFPQAWWCNRGPSASGVASSPPAAVLEVPHTKVVCLASLQKEKSVINTTLFEIMKDFLK
jgi:hypothetical protein